MLQSVASCDRSVYRPSDSLGGSARGIANDFRKARTISKIYSVLSRRLVLSCSGKSCRGTPPKGCRILREGRLKSRQLSARERPNISTSARTTPPGFLPGITLTAPGKIRILELKTPLRTTRQPSPFCRLELTVIIFRFAAIFFFCKCPSLRAAGSSLLC